MQKGSEEGEWLISNAVDGIYLTRGWHRGHSQLAPNHVDRAQWRQ